MRMLCVVYAALGQAHWRQAKRDLCEFKASLIYKVNTRLVTSKNSSVYLRHNFCLKVDQEKIIAAIHIEYQYFILIMSYFKL